MELPGVPTVSRGGVPGGPAPALPPCPGANRLVLPLQVAEKRSRAARKQISKVRGGAC